MMMENRDDFIFKQNKKSILLSSEKYGNLLIKATPKATNGEWEMYLNDYKICSYGEKDDIQIDNDLYLSALSELDVSERLGIYQDILLCIIEMNKKMILKTDCKFEYNFNSMVIQLYFEMIYSFISDGLLNILADRDYKILFENKQYLGRDGICIPSKLSPDDMLGFIKSLLQEHELNWKRVPLLDSFENDTHEIKYQYGKYRLVSDLSKFLKLEIFIIYNEKLNTKDKYNYRNIFSPEYIVENLRDKNGLKFTIGQVRTAITRCKKMKK